VKIQSKAELKKELNRLGIKIYKNIKTQASFVKRSDVKKVLAKNPQTQGIIDLIHELRTAIDANNRTQEAKLQKKLAKLTLDMMKPVASKFSKDLKAFLKEKEKEMSAELDGLPFRLIFEPGKPYSGGSNNSNQAARFAHEIFGILDPVTE